MTEQLKALAEAAQGWEWLCDDTGCGCREAMEAFQKEATPERILALIAENERYRVALDRLARLGNGTMFGNSKGNNIAIEALGETK